MDKYLKLDPMSEWLALSTFRNTRNVVVLAGEYIGRTDDELRRLAVRRTMEQRPHLGMRLEEIRSRGKHYLVWTEIGEAEPPIKITDLRSQEKTGNSFDTMLNVIKPRLDREWELFHAPPWEYHVIRLEEDRQISALICHHVVAAAVDGSSILASIGANYLELSSGEKPKFPRNYEMVSTATKKQRPKRKKNLKEALYKNLLKIAGLGKSPALPEGDGDPRSREQYHFKLLLDAEATENLIEKAKSNEAGVVDYLISALKISMDKWNESYNAFGDLIRTYATINLKGEGETAGRSNSFGFFFIKTRAAQRADERDLVRLISRKRSNQTGMRAGMKSYQNIEFLVNLIRHGPLSLRKRVVSAFMGLNRFSMGVTYMGRTLISENGEGEDNSMSATQPGLEVADVHGFGHKLVPGAPLVFTLYIFRGRLNMVSSVSGRLFSEASARKYSEYALEGIRRISGP